MRVIMLTTVQHTGTWFMISLLCDHPAVNGFVELHQACLVALSGDPLTQRKHQARLDLAGINVVHTHYWAWENSKEDAVRGAVFTLMCTLPSVVTLRDPLRSLITRESRHPNLDHEDLLDAWVHMVENLEALSKVNAAPFLFPIDLRQAEADRRELILRMFEHVMPSGDHIGYAAKRAATWPTEAAIIRDVDLRLRYNTKRDSPLRDAYNARDVAFIKSSLGGKWDALQRRENSLRPFLEEQGYRGLMWWTQ